MPARSKKMLNVIVLAAFLITLIVPVQASATALSSTGAKPVELVVSPTSITLPVAYVAPVKVSVKYNDGSIREASMTSVGYVSSNPKVAIISGGKVVGLSPGNAAITLVLTPYGLKKTINVNVVSQIKSGNTVVKPVSLQVSPASVTLKTGESKTITVTTKMSDGTTRAVSQAVFVITNPRVATVKNGALVGVNPGGTTVTVSSNGLSAQIAITVLSTSASQAATTTTTTTQSSAGKATAAVPVALEVLPKSITLEVGETVPFKANLRYSDGSTKDISSMFTINAQHAQLANGTVRGVAPGQGTFTLKYGNLQATLAVKVELEPITTSITPPTLDTSLGAVEKTISWQYEGARTLRVAVPKDLLRWDEEVKNVIKKYYTSNGYVQDAMEAGMPSELKSLVLAAAASANSNLTPWVNEPYNLTYIRKVADDLEAVAAGMNRYQTAQMVLNMVQSLSYHNVEYPQAASKTLVEGGDCDAKSVLLAALLKEMGYKAALIYYSPSAMGGKEGHMQVGVVLNDNDLPQNGRCSYVICKGQKYYFMETTMSGWKVGDRALKKTPTAVYPVN